MPQRKESLLERLDRLIKAGPFPHGTPPAGPGCGDPLHPPGAPAAVVTETLQVLVRLGMKPPDAARRVGLAAARGDDHTTVQDLINLLFKET